VRAELVRLGPSIGGCEDVFRKIANCEKQLAKVYSACAMYQNFCCTALCEVPRFCSAVAQLNHRFAR
jgi:hypothetical protein